MDEQAILTILHEVIDPEIGVNVVDLGLVYGVQVQEGSVHLRMTMTTPACPLGPMIMDQIDEVIHRHWPEVKDVDVEVVWDPPWSYDRMSAAARAELGM